MSLFTPPPHHRPETVDDRQRTLTVTRGPTRGTATVTIVDSEGNHGEYVVSLLDLLDDITTAERHTVRLLRHGRLRDTRPARSLSAREEVERSS